MMRALTAARSRAAAPVVTYGESEDADLRISEISSAGSSSSPHSCPSRRRAYRRADPALKVPGIHNQLNASAAFASALISGYEAADIAPALAEFVGADRRFTLRGEVAGVKVFDDYAHHPTECSGCLGDRSYRG